MFRANLSFVLLNKYLDFLLKNGFIEAKDGLFFPTHAGMVYLQRFARYSRARDSFVRSEAMIHSSVLAAKEPLIAH
jgi:predicted transcriptional regulator